MAPRLLPFLPTVRIGQEDLAGDNYANIGETTPLYTQAATATQANSAAITETSPQTIESAAVAQNNAAGIAETAEQLSESATATQANAAAMAETIAQITESSAASQANAAAVAELLSELTEAAAASQANSAAIGESVTQISELITALQSNAAAIAQTCTQIVEFAYEGDYNLGTIAETLPMYTQAVASLQSNLAQLVEAAPTLAEAAQGIQSNVAALTETLTIIFENLSEADAVAALLAAYPCSRHHLNTIQTGANYYLVLDTGLDISTMSDFRIHYLTPDGDTDYLSAQRAGQKVYAQITGDFNAIAGTWKFQASALQDADRLYGNTVIVYAYEGPITADRPDAVSTVVGLVSKITHVIYNQLLTDYSKPWQNYTYIGMPITVFYNAGFDISGAIEASFNVQKPDGSIIQLSANKQSRYLYTTIPANQNTMAGIWRIHPVAALMYDADPVSGGVMVVNVRELFS